MSSDFTDHYAVLHVPRTATQREIARAYRSLMRTHHPDLDNPTAVPAELQLIMQAFEVLHDPKRRLAYDREFLRRERRSGTTAAARAGPPEQDRPRAGQPVGDTPAAGNAGGRQVPVNSEATARDIPIRRVRHVEPPFRVTPVRWESGPWANGRSDPRGEQQR
jgi:curved DNA-binding protein CbpA